MEQAFGAGVWSRRLEQAFGAGVWRRCDVVKPARFYNGIWCQTSGENLTFVSEDVMPKNLLAETGTELLHAYLRTHHR